MKRFLRGGLFAAVGISLLTALIIALTRSEKLRKGLGKRLEVLRNARPSSEQLRQSIQQAGTKVQKTRSVLSHLMQQSARRVTQLLQKGRSLVEPSAQLVVEQHEQDSSKKLNEDRIHTLEVPVAE